MSKDVIIRVPSAETIFYGIPPKVTISSSFENIQTIPELIAYLKKPFSRVGNRKKSVPYLYHYTNVDGLIGIVNSKSWHLCQARCMNDKLEFQKGDKSIWQRTYFSSFILDDEENIGLWSMYGQPWNKGVKIALPIDVVKKWLACENRIFSVNCKTKQKVSPINAYPTNLLGIFACSIAYVDYEINYPVKLHCGTVDNEKVFNEYSFQELTGYVKSNAWQYEKEIRIRAEFRCQTEYQRIAVEINDELLNSMVLTPSPLFEGDLYKLLLNSTNRELNVRENQYSNKIYLNSDCMNCKYNH